MKRLSLFAAVLFAAVMSFAQAPAITFSAVSATGTLKDSTFATTNLTVQTVDPDSKMQIDANPAVFKGNGIAEITCTHRLKTGGKTNEAVTKNYMKLMASEAGTLLIGVRTGSNSDATRKLVVSQNGAEIFNDFISEALKDSVVNDGGKAYFYHMVEVPVAAGQIILSYPVNGLNFYCFALLVAGETKTVATVEKLWSGEPMGWTTADTRQWAGFGDYVYWESKANHTIYGTHDGVNVDTIFTNAAIDGTAFCLDGAGNFIVEGIFPSTPSHLFLLKHDTTAYVDIPITGLGRTDIITATGDVFSAEGGFVFVHGNGKNLLVYTIKNAGTPAQEVVEKTIAIAGSSNQNYIVAGDTAVQYAQRRSSGQAGFYLYENGVDKGAIAMPGYKASTLSGAMVNLAGKDFAIYPAGTTNYSSEFSVFNMTDSAMAVDKADATKTVFFANTATRANGTNVGVFATATKIDENNAYIQVGNGSDGVALFKLNVTVAAEVSLSCDEAQGTVSGAGDVALGANATVTATPKPGYEFMAWKNGETTVSTDATYTFAVNGNIALTAVFEAKENVTITLAVNDANLGSITMPEGMVMGANSIVYGTVVSLTAVPTNGATFMGWYKGEDLYSDEYTIELNGKESISLTGKFVNILTVAYELNGGITNDSNWVSKGQLMLEIQNDYNTAYNSSLAVVKYQNGIYYFKIGDNWVPEAEAQGQAATVAGFFQNKTWSADQKCANLFLNNPKYQFLVDLIDHFKGTAHQAAEDPSGLGRTTDNLSEMVIGTADAYFRADVSGFMLNSPATDAYPYTCNWSICGTPAALNAAWKHAFANPTEVVTEVTLNAPYKEGFTFDGWYATSDFSGVKITTVSPESNIPGGTLYAKWIEYIQTIQEAIASDSLANVKTAGTVNFVDGKQVYIQDATAAVLVYMKAAQNVVPGDYIVVTGKNVIYNGAPEISDGEIKSTESGHPLNPENTATLAALKADMLKYFGKRIKIDGLVIASYDANGNTYVTDGIDTVECYKVKANQTTFPVGTRVNIRLIGGAYKGAFQFVGPTDGIELAPLSGRDNYVYPARGESGEYTLTNKWLICEKLENYSANRPAGTNFCRGMAAKDGKMYFVNREIGGFTVVDGATGEMLDPLMITGDHLFQAQDSAGAWKDCVTLKFNDVKFDNAGNCLVTACASGAQRVMVYKVDLTTGAATEVINERLYDNPDFYIDEENKDSWRMDAIGVYGDVNNHAIVMFGNSYNADLHAAYMWEINNGVAAPAERIDLVVNEEDDTYLWKEPGVLYTENSSACQVFPVDENYFYWDHHSCRPTLFSMDGTFADDLKACPTNVVVVNNPGDTCKVGSGHNGICEFQIGEDYFVIMAATNNVENPAGSFALFKYADAAKAFSGLTPLWYFPAGGMGTMTNVYRTAVPTVEVREDKAYIYLYTGENGYGVYEMTGVRSGLTNTKDDVKALKVVENGQVYIIRNGVRYTVLGAQVSK